MKSFSRTQRVAEQIKKELAQLIQWELRDPRIGMVTVNEVVISKDLNQAKVYVTTMIPESAKQVRSTSVKLAPTVTAIESDELLSPEQQCIALLNHASGYLRTLLAKSIKMRATPQLKFFYDDSLARGHHMNRVIHQAIELDRNKTSK